jgi:hypothetical protein
MAGSERSASLGSCNGADGGCGVSGLHDVRCFVALDVEPGLSSALPVLSDLPGSSRCARLPRWSESPGTPVVSVSRAHAALRDQAGVAPEGTSREQACGTRRQRAAIPQGRDRVTTGIRNRRPGPATSSANFASRRSPVRSRLAPSEKYLQIGGFWMCHGHRIGPKTEIGPHDWATFGSLTVQPPRRAGASGRPPSRDLVTPSMSELSPRDRLGPPELIEPRRSCRRVSAIECVERLGA